MATENSSNIRTLIPTPGDAVLTALARRLREHAAKIKNAECRRTMGKDMVAAADAIERLRLDSTVQEANAAAMVVLLGHDGFAAYTGGRANG